MFEFERWYSEEFEPNPADQMGVNHSTLLTYQGGTTEGATEQQDDEAEAYIRAKRNVDTLHRAKKMEKQRPAGFKK